MRDQPNGFEHLRHSPGACMPVLLMSVILTILIPEQVAASDLSTLFQRTKPSVVRINCSKAGVNGFWGSGFVFASNSQTTEMITANHVVQGGQHIRVVFDSNLKRQYPATIVSSDVLEDVAVLRVNVGNRRPLLIEDISQVHEGQPVAIIGYPRAVNYFTKIGDVLQPTITSGTISAIRIHGKIIQIDAAVDYGNSGGPILNPVSGRVVGIARSFSVDDNDKPLPGTALGTSAAAIRDVLQGSKRSDPLLQRLNLRETAGPDSWDSNFGHAIDKLLMVLVWIVLAGLIVIAALVAQLYASWRIVSKAGYSGWWRFFALLPILNLIVLYIVAFSKWPLERKVERLGASTHEPNLQTRAS